MTKGGPPSANLFNIMVMVDAVVREWLRILREDTDLEREELNKMTETLFAIFYVNDACIAARDPILLQ